MSYALWMSKPLKTAISVVDGWLYSDLWQHNFGSRYAESENYMHYFSSIEDLLAFEKKIEVLSSSIYLRNTGEHLQNIMDASAPDSWLSVVLARAKQTLSGTIGVRKLNDYNGNWEFDEQEKKDLKEMIDDVITNLNICMSCWLRIRQMMWKG